MPCRSIITNPDRTVDNDSTDILFAVYIRLHSGKLALDYYIRVIFRCREIFMRRSRLMKHLIYKEDLTIAHFDLKRKSMQCLPHGTRSTCATWDSL